MLEFNAEQVAGLADIDAKRFVSAVGADLLKDEPALSTDATLNGRLWRAFKVARSWGISGDDNIVAFLRIEARSPGFYEKPATRAWITKPGRSSDERFHDYLRVVRWHVLNPGFE